MLLSTITAKCSMKRVGGEVRSSHRIFKLDEQEL